MKVGQTRVETTPITGYSTRTYKIITENGKTTEELANSSNYVKRDKVVYVGTIQPETAKQPETSTDSEKDTTGATETAGWCPHTRLIRQGRKEYETGIYCAGA